MKKLYVVIPCYNEEEVLNETAKRLEVKMNSMIEEDLISKDSRVVLVNDGSKDKTWKMIEELHKNNPSTIDTRCSNRRDMYPSLDGTNRRRNSWLRGRFI